MIIGVHKLEKPTIVTAIERSVSSHVGRRWSSRSFRNLDERASHPCGIHCGDDLDVFVKFCADQSGANQFGLECRGLRFLRERGGARTAETIGEGVVTTDEGTLLLLSAITERAPQNRTTEDWRSIGHTLGLLHEVTGTQFGLEEFDGYFGRIYQNNRPVATNTWFDFFRQRRIEPFLQEAIKSGNLPEAFIPRVVNFVDRLPALADIHISPSLLHGDAQQNNYLSNDAGAVVIDASPYFGHPEMDLALVDIFQPVPVALFDAYRDVRAIDPEFDGRRELWRIPTYLVIIAEDGGGDFGEKFIPRLDEALRTFT
jgi:protein-ribulosamine 3-kinase